MFSVITEGCHVGYSREFVGTVYCTYGQSNTTINHTAGKLSTRERHMVPVTQQLCLDQLVNAQQLGEGMTLQATELNRIA